MFAQPDAIQFSVDLEKIADLKGSQLLVLESNDPELSFEKILSHRQAFEAFEKGKKLSADVIYWGWLRIHNPQSRDIDWVFSPDWGKTTKRNSLVDVYITSPDSSRENYRLRTGKYLPNSQKDGIAKSPPNNQVELNLAPGETQDIFFRLESIEKRQPLIHVQLMSYAYWVEQAPVLRNILQAIFHGIFWFMFFNALLNFYTQKSTAYLYYALFLAATSIYFLSVSGILMEIFLKENPKWNTAVWVFATNLLGIGYFQFARHFLNTKKLMPFWDRIGVWIIRGGLIMILVELILLIWMFDFVFLERLNRAILFLEINFLLIVSLIYVKGTRGLWRIFFWGTLCIVAAGYLGIILDFLGLFQASLPVVEFMFVVQTLNFSLGLGYRQAYLKKVRSREEAKVENLKQLDNMKSTFFANISHEFRTPLTLLLGISDQLKSNWREFSEEKIVNELKALRKNGKALLSLVNRILDLTRLDNLSYEANWQNGDIIKFIESRVAPFFHYAEARNKTFEIRTEIPRLEMDFDPDAYESILNNLISNALKFTPEGGRVRLRLSIEDGAQLEQYFVIKVEDNGFGIPARDLPHLFKRFYQSTSNPAHTAGSGIGLSLVKGLVEMLEGSISVKSKMDEGTSFRLSLPIKSEHQPHLLTAETEWIVSEIEGLDGPVRSPEQERKILPDFSKNLIMLVEDDPDIVTFLRSILETQYRLAIARNGAEGIQLALELVPDLIVSDVSMPEKNGFELTQSLKEDERTSHIPIILLTARAEEKDRMAGLSVGADAYLLKPFKQAELELRIRKLIEVREQMRRYFAGKNKLVEKTPSKEQVFLDQIRKIVLANILNPEFDVDLLAEKMNLSYTQLYRKLKALTNHSASLIIRDIRLDKAAELLRNSDETIAEIAYATGFNDPAYFSRAFSRKFEMPPSVYRGV